jgi:acyl-CoA synthetase (NDP forming)
MSRAWTGYPLGDGADGRRAVAEPEVKAALAERGVAVPAGAVVDAPDELAAAAKALDAPLVLKAFGPGLVHKSDVGAVVLGLDHDGLEAAAVAMGERLAGHGLTPAGFLVEEQATTGGVELIVGVVQRAPFGPVVALGLGGTLTEVLDQVALRLCPLSEADARDLVRTFPAAKVLAGVRGAPPVDEDALVALLLAIAGEDGLVAELGDELAELECNPVLAGPDGALALDARLVLQPPADAGVAGAALEDGALTDFARLFQPRGIAVAGASANKPGFGNRALAAFRSAGWTDGLHAVHPTATEIDGVPAVASVADLPDDVDYLLVTVPAARCADLVRETAGRIPFVHVVSGGFGEAGPDGAQLGVDLAAAGRDVGTRLIGPNCIGIYSPTGRQAFQLGDPTEPGVVGAVSQSGGLGGDIIKGGAQRGLRFSQLATVGNAIDVTPGELVRWMVADDDATEVVGVYLEGGGDAVGLVDALRAARGRVPVALLLGGQSEQGAAAVASHTGSLAGDGRIWGAIGQATGAALTTTLEDLLAVLSYAQRWRGTAAADDPGVLVIGVGGGASVLATDACDRAGLQVTPTGPEVRELLAAMGYGVGTNLTNPVEIPFGPVVPVDTLRKVLEPVLAAQGYPDVLVHVNVQAYFSYGTRGIEPLIEQLDHLAAGDWSTTRLGIVVRNLDCAPGAEAERLRAAVAEAGLPMFRDFDEAATAIAALKRFTAHAAAVAGP